MKAAPFSRSAAGILVALYLAAGAAPAYGQNGWEYDGSVVRLTTSTDKVGIGNSTPLTALHISGNMSDTPGGGGITLSDDGTPTRAFQLRMGATDKNFHIDALWGGSWTERLTILRQTGNIGIGTAAPQSLLAVNGTITAKEVEVTSSGWSDYVFAPGYNLMPLSAVAAYIEAHGHLPEVPSAEEVAANGLSLGESQALLLKKIEELTLYMIAMQQENEALRERVGELEEK